MGLRGRLAVQCLCLALEGALLVAFSKQKDLAGAIPCLVASGWPRPSSLFFSPAARCHAGDRAQVLVLRRR